MKIHPSKDHADGHDGPSTDQPPAEQQLPSRHGFGHKAYQPDPAASYGFDPGPPRVLPTEPRRRWRLSG